VSLSTAVLRDRVGYYTFISSIAAYADSSRVNREGDPTLELDGDRDHPVERAYGGSSLYGPMKARCEQVIAAAFAGGWAAVRPTSVAGPHDLGASNLRTGYWAARVRDYDEILVPRPRDRIVSYIDVRDLAEWIVTLPDRGATGAFNAAAPTLTIDEFLKMARGAYGTSTMAVWADPNWLLDQGVKPNVELPWWVPEKPCLFAVDAARATAHGLTIRPIEQTIRDSADWEDVRPQRYAPQSPLAGQARGVLMSRERELELLERWRARVGARATLSA
jgi:2'-hydroxyisoflavone reductase